MSGGLGLHTIALRAAFNDRANNLARVFVANQLLMPGTNPEDAMRVTERLRAAVEGSPMAPGVPVVGSW